MCIKVMRQGHLMHNLFQRFSSPALNQMVLDNTHMKRVGWTTSRLVTFPASKGEREHFVYTETIKPHNKFFGRLILTHKSS